MSKEEQNPIVKTDLESNQTEEVEYELKEKPRCHHRKRIISICVLIISIALLFIILNSVNNGEHTNAISATLSRGGSFHKRACDYYEYGCCHIYSGCSIKNNYIDYDINRLNVYKIHAHDNRKSNCPSLRTLINNYNFHYGNETCGKYGCCPDFDIGCDDAIHYHINDGNNQHLIDYYQNHINVMIPIKTPKIDELGTNCWDQVDLHGVDHFIDKYNHDYPDQRDGETDPVIIVLIIIVWCLIAHVCAK